ncbi:MAG: OmpA family protein [Acetobacteraceae bacterium]|nr:OmpA family protein [Acetobacteraceae bacterium]
MKVRSALLATAMMVLPLTVANAQAVDGLYVAGGLGLNFKQSVTAQPTVGASTRLNSEIGPAGVLSLGYGFGNGLRTEVEGGYRQNQFQKSGGVTEHLAGVMANVLYDFTGLIPAVQPYVGAGAGYQWGTLSGVAGLSNSSVGSFAYQGIAGVGFPINAVPGLALTAEYRFLGLTSSRTYSATPAGFKLTNDFNHSAMVGFRYAFGAAPLAAAPMPMTDTGAKTFLVFFDWDKADLTSRSQGIVVDAAAYSTKTKYTRIDVDGNTDTTGSAGHNQGLSERRARIVAAELVRNGVPQSAISMHAFGDTKLLVPTGAGTREPQNRRVEIVYR